MTYSHHANALSFPSVHHTKDEITPYLLLLFILKIPILFQNAIQKADKKASIFHLKIMAAQMRKQKNHI